MIARMRISRLGRPLLSLFGLLFGLAVAEVGLRLQSANLPSLAALDNADPLDLAEYHHWSDPPATSPGCHPSPGVAPRRKRSKFTPDERPRKAGSLDLWVVGDSVVFGFGVGSNEGWAARLGARLASARPHPVQLSRLGGPGSGWCAWLTDLNAALDSGPPPDAAILQVFADDLEDRGVILVGGREAARPGYGAPAWAAPALRHSWLLNQLWFSWVTHLGPDVPLRAEGPVARDRFVTALTQAGARLEEKGVPWTLALVAPAGQPLCNEDQPRGSDCAWMAEDLARLADWLGSSQLPWLDLRQAWQDRPSDLLPAERIAWETRGRLPVHPGPLGHAALAEAAWPWLNAAIPPAP